MNSSDEEENQDSVSQINEIKPSDNCQEVTQVPENNAQPLKKSSKSQVSNEEKLIILLKRENRTLNELISIEQLTQDLKFFEQINKDQANQKVQLHRKICKYLNFDFRQKGKVVFYQGDMADSFFIVLQGRCLVLINDKDQNQQQPQQTGTQRMSFLATGQNFSTVLNQLMFDSKKQASSPAGHGGQTTSSKKRFSILMKGQNSLNLLSTLKMLRWRLFHKIVWLVIYANRFIRYSQKKCIEVQDPNTMFLHRLFRFIGPKSFMNEKIQRLRKEIQQSVHPEIDLQYLENVPHFFDRHNNLGFIYKPIKIYEKGESFGELGLLSRKPRSATVICLTDCIFASLYKQHYSNTLKEVEQQQINKRIEFIFQTFMPRYSKSNDKTQTNEQQEDQISNIKIDRNLISFSESRLNQIQLYFTKVKFLNGKVLQKQGDSIEKLYIIKKGDVSCQMDVIDEKNPSNNLKINLCLLGKYEIVGDEIILQGSQNKKQNQAQKAMENENKNEAIDAQANQSNSNAEVKICYYTATVKSYNCSLLAISKQDFKRMISDFPEIKKYIKMKTQTKIEWMEQRKKQQIQIIKKINLNKEKIPLSDEQHQMIKENAHILRKKQFKNKKWIKQDSGIIRSPIPSQKEIAEFQQKKYQNSFLQNQDQKSPEKISKQSSPQKSPQKNIPKTSISRNQTYQNEVNNLMISYFQKELLSTDQLNKQNIKDEEKDQVLYDALAIKYGYKPQSLSNQKLKPSQIIDFIFNHKENEHEQQNQQIHQLSEVNSEQIDSKYILNYSLDRKKNQQKNNKHLLKVDYTTLGYSDTLLQNIKRKQSMQAMSKQQDQSESYQNKSTEQSTLKKKSNSVEKPKKKLHISHDAEELRLINKINRQILKTTQEVQKTKAFYNQSQEIFINNLASSSKSSTVSPLKYKYMFNSKIQKKQEFEKLFNKTINSPKQKNLNKQISMNTMRDSNFSRQKSSLHSNVSTESLSPTHKLSTPINQVLYKSSTLIKSPSLNILNRQLSISKIDSPYDFSSCIKQTSFTIPQRQSHLIQQENIPQIKRFDSLNLADSNWTTDQNNSKDNQKIHNLMTPPNASRGSIQKLNRIIQQSPSLVMSQDLTKQKTQQQDTNEQSQQISNFLSQTCQTQHSQQSEQVQDQQKFVARNKFQNQNISLFRQVPLEKQKQLSGILNKFCHTPQISDQNFSEQSSAKSNKEVNIHVLQKNQQQQQQHQNRSSSGGTPQKYIPFKKNLIEKQNKKFQNYSLDQNAFQGLLIKSQTGMQTEAEKQMQNKQQEISRLKKSVFSMQAVQSSKLDSPQQTQKETPIQSSDKIVILNHMGKPVNYYVSHQQQQTSLTNLEVISPKCNKQILFSQPNVSQNSKLSSNQIFSQNDVYSSSQFSTSLLSPKLPQSLQLDANTQQNNENYVISKSQSSSHFNFDPYNNSQVKSKQNK